MSNNDQEPDEYTPDPVKCGNHCGRWIDSMRAQRGLLNKPICDACWHELTRGTTLQETKHDLHLEAAMFDGTDGVTMKLDWQGKRFMAAYQGGVYAEIYVGNYIEVIYQEQEFRDLWQQEDGPDLRIALLYSMMDEWCRVQDKENDGWYEQYEGYSQWRS